MPGNDHTRVSGEGGSEEGRAVRALIAVERRMGRTLDGEKIDILFGAQMIVGRDRSCDICLEDDRVSRKHALIGIDRDAARVSDLGSTNGTTRNGEPVSEEIILETGDLVCLGQGRTYEVRIVEREGLITSVRLASGSEAYLLVPQEFVIGHAVSEMADQVDLKLYDPALLPMHARIEFFAGQTFIVSLDPTRPVVVNSTPAREQELRNNYLIEVGDTLLRFERMD